MTVFWQSSSPALRRFCLWMGLYSYSVLLRWRNAQKV